MEIAFIYFTILGLVLVVNKKFWDFIDPIDQGALDGKRNE